MIAQQQPTVPLNQKVGANVRKITWFYVAGAFVGSITPLLCQILIYLVLKAGTANLAQKIVLCLISACFVPYQIKAAVRFGDLVKFKIEKDKKVKVDSIDVCGVAADSAPVAVSSAVKPIQPINFCYNTRCRFNIKERCGITEGLWINECGFCLNTEFKPQATKPKDIVSPQQIVPNSIESDVDEKVKKVKNVKPKKTKKQIDF